MEWLQIQFRIYIKTTGEGLKGEENMEVYEMSWFYLAYIFYYS